MSKLPQGWCECTLSDVGDIVTGNTPSKDTLENYGDIYPWVKPPDLGIDVPITTTSEFLSEQGGNLARLLPHGATLVSCIGILGKIGYAGTVLASNQQINSVVFDSRLVISRYGFHFCKTLRPWLEENSSSTTVAIVNKGRFSLAPFTLPPLNEQRRIVAKLEEVLAKVDASQKRLTRIPVILKRFRQAVLAAACSGRLTADWREENKVDEWEWSTLSKQDVSVQTGPFGSALHKHDYISNGVPLVNPMHIRDGQIHPKADQSVSESKLKELSRYLLLPGDIVLGRRGEMGRAAVVQASGLLCGTGSLFLRATSKKVVPEFLCLLLRSPFTCTFLEEGSVGSTMTNLNQQIVGAIEFPIAGNDEQQEIVRRVESFFTLANQLEARYQKAKTHVDKLTQSILAKAFRGELVPQDPNDEPASSLLERIRSQKKSVAPVRRKK